MSKQAYGKPQLAFTLVELLIVIVVIAILASITVVTYSGVKDRALDTVMATTTKSLQGGLLMKQAVDGTTMVDPVPSSRRDLLTSFNAAELDSKVEVVFWDQNGCVSSLSDDCTQGYLSKDKVVLAVVNQSGASSAGVSRWSHKDGVYHIWTLAEDGSVTESEQAG